MKTQDQILKALGNIEGKVDGINQRLDRVNGNIKNHDDRINEIEHTQDVMTGKATIIGTILGLIGAGIVALLKQ